MKLEQVWLTMLQLATFELQKDIIIADLKNINKISPFSIPDANFLVNYAINKEHLSKINEEMSKVVRLSDTKLVMFQLNTYVILLKLLREMALQTK